MMLPSRVRIYTNRFGSI
uniref:Uncharacterized protein n=1 Tax=Rhizophora mucronata TaxID=61149 RepID=A0A2P2R0F8_RHIMU